MASNVQLKAVISAEDRASRTFKAVGGKLGALAKTAAIAGAAVAGVVAGGLVVATKKAMDFEKQMGNIATLLDGDVKGSMEVISEQIKNIAKELPVDPDELGAAAYDVVSAGITNTAEQFVVLRNSAILAITGLGTTAEATDLVTSALNTFGIDASKSESVANIFFKTVKSGKNTVADLAQAFGTTASIMKTAGVTLEDFSAATAAMTSTGVPASVAQRNLAQSVISLQKPTETMQGLFDKIGVESLPELLDKGKNLGGVFNLIEDAADGNNSVMAEAFGSVEALNAALQVGSTVNEKYTETLADMESGTITIRDALETQMDTATSAWQLIKNSLSIAMLDLGERILPLVKDGLAILIDFWKRNGTIIQSTIMATLETLFPIIKNVFNFIIDNKDAIIGAFIGIGAAMATIMIVTEIASLIALFNPLTLAIAALVAVGALLGVAWMNNWGGIREVVGKAIEFLKPSFDSLVDAVKGLIETFKIFWSEHGPQIMQILKVIGVIIGAVLVVAIKFVIEYIKIMITYWVWLLENVLPPVVNFIMEKLIPAWQNFVDVVGPIIQGFFTILGTLFGPTWEMIVGMFKASLIGLKFAWDTIWSVIKTTFSVVWAGIKFILLTAWNFISGSIRVGMAVLKGDWSGAWAAIKQIFTDQFSNIKNTASGLIDDIVGFFADIPGRVSGALTGFGGVISSALSASIRAVPGVGNIVADALGMKAIGGPVSSGTPYIVGEQGPELFVPNQGGKIIPAQQTAGMTQNMGGVTINISGAGDPRGIAEQVSRILTMQSELASKAV